MMELLLSLFGGFILTEVHVCLPAFAKWVIRLHAAKMPSALRERMLEEWLAEVDASPSHVQKAIFALGLFMGIADLLRAHGEQKAIHGDLNVTLTGVSAVGSGGVQISGHAHIRIEAAPAVLTVGSGAGASTVIGVGASIHTAVGISASHATVKGVGLSRVADAARTRQCAEGRSERQPG